MNWKQIEKKYPKSFEKWFTQSGFIYSLDVDFLNDAFDDRDLYDFFDEHNIFVELHVWHYKNKKTFSYVITGEYSCHPSAKNEQLIDRKTAESEAFTKAFELLEGILK